MYTQWVEQRVDLGHLPVHWVDLLLDLQLDLIVEVK